jgi:hypothetical protein
MSESFLVLNEEIPQELRLPAVAIYIADIFGKQKFFWNIVLEYPKPESFNDAAGIAVRQFVEMILPNLGPNEILRRVTPVILDPESGWSSLGIKSINDEFIGSPLTAQMKLDLLNILNLSAKTFLENIATEINQILALYNN